MQSSNPVLTRKESLPSSGYATFNASPQQLEDMYARPAFRTMTVEDVVMRTGMALGVVFVAGALAWALKLDALAFPAMIAAFVLSLVITFKQVTNPAAILSYAGLIGLALGSISRLFEEAYSGIVVQAVLGTALVFGAMVVLYRSGRLRATPKFTKVMVASGFAILGVVVIDLIASLVSGGSFLFDGGPMAILITLAFIVWGALSFILDFDLVEKAAAGGAPEKFAWYAAFGIVVGLVWLYINLLRLLSYFRE
jgi:uncharacterized YccA/Bax inhibitor family protein